MFFKGSRYASVEETEITDAAGHAIRHKKVRFIPRTPARVEYVVTQGDRLDLIADRFFRDPERFWRICDANLALFPDDLVAEIGRRILIPPPEG